MLAARKVPRQQIVSSSKSSLQQDHQFPDGIHLLITTPRRILAWDSTGTHTIYESSQDGIAAAREAPGGTGWLAIAGKHAVVLHDTKRCRETSWGLGLGEDEIRHLEYSVDGKSLFLSTVMTHGIQQYSFEQSALVSIAQNHVAPPTALAVSPTGHLMISAADHPPVVYHKNLTHNTPSMLIEPRASKSAVSVIAFHPERPDIFLLAFKDGTITAYNSTKFGRITVRDFPDQAGIQGGELARLTNLHRPNIDNKTPAITGAAFIPGYDARVITVGTDGRCHVVDLTNGGKVKRTWHAKAPLTSVSVVAIQRENGPPTQNHGSLTYDIPDSTRQSPLFSVGRIDGIVHIYNTLGVLMDQRALGLKGEKIVGVEWVRGPSPRAISAARISAPIFTTLPAAQPRRAKNLYSKGAGTVSPASSTPKSVSLPVTRDQPEIWPVPVGREFTVHPDDLDRGTVRHRPSDKTHQAIHSDHYLDLFSPVKSNFVLGPVNNGSQKGAVCTSRSPAKTRSVPIDRAAAAPSLNRPIDHIGIVEMTGEAAEKCAMSYTTEKRSCTQSALHDDTTIDSVGNVQILSQLRKLGAVHSPYSRRAVRSPNRSARKHITRVFQRSTDHVETDLHSLKAFRAYDDAHRQRSWLSDSVQASSLEDDIWLTSSSEKEAKHSRRRPTRTRRRQHASQKKASGRAIFTTQNPVLVSPLNEFRHDGSADEDMQTARTHLSPSGNLSPSSHDVRQLFPRASSLSTQKRRIPRASNDRAISPSSRTLRELSVNRSHAVEAKYPWKKVHAQKAKQSQTPPSGPLPVMVAENSVNVEARVNAVAACDACNPTRLRVAGLENEVARLKAEVLALKAALRHGGMLLPAILR